jgi:uncharacterized small protein (DUF1192 family)
MHLSYRTARSPPSSRHGDFWETSLWRLTGGGSDVIVMSIHTREDVMTQHLDLALEAELSHRRAALQHDAERHQLARLASRAARAAAARVRPARATTAPAPAARRTPTHA